MPTTRTAAAIAVMLGVAACGDSGDEADSAADIETGDETGATETGAEPCPTGEVACDDNCIEPIEPTLAAIQSRIFAGCVFQACHGETGFREELQLTTVAVSHQNLVGVAAIQRPDWPRVDPGAPEHSYLINKLRGEDMSPSSGGMPSMQMPIGAPLCEAKIAAVEQWIADGALEE